MKQKKLTQIQQDDIATQDAKDALDWQNSHAFCKGLLSSKRKEYKCSQIRISCIKDVNGWSIYIDPEGYEGFFRGCCRYNAMIEALDSKFGIPDKHKA